MRYDRDKVDEMVLALLYLTTHDKGTRAWKGMDWDAMDRLHDKGFIGNPKTKSKSVTLTEKGQRLSEEFFKKHFGLT
jgi:predicted transcriptional regulator